MYVMNYKFITIWVSIMWIFEKSRYINLKGIVIIFSINQCLSNTHSFSLTVFSVPHVMSIIYSNVI